MEYELQNRTALVTGAGRGNGKAIATELAESGADVLVNDIDQDVAEETANDLRERGADAIGVAADVSDDAEVEAMVETAADELGTVDIVVNNAGVVEVEKFQDEPDDDIWQFQLDVHLYGAIHCTKHALDGMLEQGDGRVINITSIHTKNGIGLSPQYDVAKFALLGLTKTLALELGPEGITVNAVAPGWVNTRNTEVYTDRTREQITDLNPMGRFAEPEEIGHAVAFLASPGAAYVNGHEFRVDGGQQPIDRWKYEGYRWE
jgi:3-oxoacyl-[acyl-carrier protein] reductase